MVDIGDEVIVNGYRGVVKFVGGTQFADGIWYGIELEECVGRNDGSVENKKYFDLEKEGLYGIFARLSSLKLINGTDTNDGDHQELVLQENKRLIDENTKLRLRLENMNSEGPYDVIEFLTIQNTELSKNIDTLKNEIVELKQKEGTHIKLQAVYVEVEKELREQLEEFHLLYKESIDSLKDENTKLMQGLADKDDPHIALMDLRSKLKVMEQEIYENRFLMGFYQLSSKEETRKPRFQFNYLCQRIMNDRIRNSFLAKQKCRFVLLVLSEIARVVEETDAYKSFQRGVGDASKWTASFLEGFIPENRIELTSIFNFLNENPEVDHNFLLMVNCMETTFGSIMPDLLAFHLEKTSSELDVKLVSEIYSTCLSIEKRCQGLMKNVSEGEKPLPSENLSAQILLDRLFKEILSQFECALDVRRILELVKDIFDQVNGVELVKLVGNAELVAPKVPNGKAAEIKVLNSDVFSSKITHLEALLDDKDAKISELLVKIQILQQRVADLEGQEKAFNSLRTKLDLTEKENSQLLKSICNFEKLIGDLQKALKREEVKAYQICPNESFTSLASELVAVEKVDLISEIRDLRHIVAGYIDKATSTQEDLDWLKQTGARPSWLIDVPFKNEIHKLTNDVLDFVNYSASVNLEEKNVKKNYFSNAMFKKTVIEMGLRDAIREK